MIGLYELLFLLALWIGPSIVVARYADRKGHSYTAFVLAALFISWPLAWLIAAAAPDKREPGQP